jgi:hypothetical protein
VQVENSTVARVGHGGGLGHSAQSGGGAQVPHSHGAGGVHLTQSDGGTHILQVGQVAEGAGGGHSQAAGSHSGHDVGLVLGQVGHSAQCEATMQLESPVLKRISIPRSIKKSSSATATQVPKRMICVSSSWFKQIKFEFRSVLALP